jgi:hypothetical protein
VPPLSAERLWWARFWRSVRAAARVPWAERRWEYEELPGGGYRRARDTTTRLLGEFEEALEVASATADTGPAVAALERLAEHVGMEPPPR